MKNLILIVCIALLFQGCSSILTSKPIGTLSEKTMAKVLVDINLTEATLRVGNDSLVRITDTTSMRNRYADIFRKNDVDPDDFNASLIYYLKHIDELDKIYNDVITQLSTLEATLQQASQPVGQEGNYMHGNPFNNPWFKTLTKAPPANGLQYFSPAIYPFSMPDQPEIPRPTKTNKVF